jgi:hypothetical protein
MRAGRRPLTFASLDAVMPDVDRLLRGHTTVGAWSLGQICSHLAQGIHRSIDGFPAKARAAWVLRKTVGRVLLRRILRAGRFVNGMTAPAECQPATGADARVEAETLRAVLRRFAAHAGPLAEHPLSGAVSRAVWERFHCIHCAHHLSFAIPTEQAAGTVLRGQ